MHSSLKVSRNSSVVLAAWVHSAQSKPQQRVLLLILPSLASWALFKWSQKLPHSTPSGQPRLLWFAFVSPCSAAGFWMSWAIWFWPSSSAFSGELEIRFCRLCPPDCLWTELGSKSSWSSCGCRSLPHSAALSFQGLAKAETLLSPSEWQGASWAFVRGMMASADWFDQFEQSKSL